MNDQIIEENFRPEAFHVGCGSYGSNLVKAEDGSHWELCAKCGDELREVNKATYEAVIDGIDCAREFTKTHRAYSMKQAENYFHAKWGAFVRKVEFWGEVKL